MARPGLLVVVAIVAGLLLAMLALSRFAPPQAAAPPAVPDAPPNGPPADAPARCRTITTPDAGCEAAWDEKRRRFFGQKD